MQSSHGLSLSVHKAKKKKTLLGVSVFVLSHFQWEITLKMIQYKNTNTLEHID